MVLHIHSDTSFMSVEEAQSHAGGHFFLSEPYDAKPMSQPVPINGPMHTVCKVIRNVMVSAAETEIGALFSNTQKGEEMRTALQEMGHLQPPTPVMTDNSTSCGIINNTVKQ
eukprot:10830836-Ditylum_brightwellii.AAC.1